VVKPKGAGGASSEDIPDRSADTAKAAP